MAYSKTEWKARQGVNLNKFAKSQEAEHSVILTNTPDSVTEPGTPFSAENMNHIEEGIAEAHSLIAAETAERQQADTTEAQTRAAADNDINAKIPNQATAENQLADKNYVNSSITATAARALTYDDKGGPFPTKADLDSAGTFYYQKQPVTPTDNDYVVVQFDETQNGGQVRYGYEGGVWVFRYKINDAPFTAAQIAAIDSGATPENIASIADKQERLSAAGQENLLTAPATPGGQPGTKAISDFLQKADVIDALTSDDPSVPLSAAMGKYLKELFDSITIGMYPIGSIYISVNPENPEVHFGGTWAPFAQGRTLIGVGSTTDSRGETINFTAGSKGGEFKHVLTAGEMPSHNHSYSANHNDEDMGGWGRAAARGAENGAWTGSTGGGAAHNNLPPYIAVYMWERTA